MLSHKKDASERTSEKADKTFLKLMQFLFNIKSWKTWKMYVKPPIFSNEHFNWSIKKILPSYFQYLNVINLKEKNVKIKFCLNVPLLSSSLMWFQKMSKAFNVHRILFLKMILAFVIFTLQIYVFYIITVVGLYENNRHYVNEENDARSVACQILQFRGL